MNALICSLALLANLLPNPEFASSTGVAPDRWSASDKAATVCTGGVVRLSQKTAPYHRNVSVTVPVDGTKSHYFTVECRCDAMLDGVKFYYSLLDAKRRPIINTVPFFPWPFKGPLADWTKVGFVLPARDPDRVKFAQLSISVYNGTRMAGAPDAAFYFRNPSLVPYEGQKAQPFPVVKADPDNPFPPEGFAVEAKPYLLEREVGVGYLNLAFRAVVLHGKRGDLKITVEAPDGVESEVHKRAILFRAGASAPERFTLRLKSTVANGRSFTSDVPVRVLPRPAAQPLPKDLNYWSYLERPLHAHEPLDPTPLARALEAYWRGTGWIPHEHVNVTPWIGYRQLKADPVCTEAVGIGGEPIGCPCDTEQIALGVDGFRRRFERLDKEGTLKTAKYALWDYEPYVLGPVTVGCWCEKCQAAFRARYDLPASVKPAEVLSNYRAKWVDFRCDQRREVLRIVTAALKEINPSVKFQLCTMPYSPGRDDLTYCERWGLDHKRFVPFVDEFTSMNYGQQDVDVFRSLEREIRELGGKPVRTMLTNGWDADGGRDPEVVRQQYLAAYFIGLTSPCMAPGLDRTRGDTLAALRAAVVEAGSAAWRKGRLADDRLPLVADADTLKLLYSVDRTDGTGRRWTLIANVSVRKTLKAVLKTPAGDVPVELKPNGYRIVESRDVVQRPFATAPRHELKKVMGRDYWTYLGFSPLTDPATWSEIAPKVWENPWNNPALTNVSVFAECGIVSSGGKYPPDAKGTASCLRTVQDHCGAEVWEGLKRNHTADRPLVFVFNAKRNVLAMEGDVDIDHEDWRRFKFEHPNLLCSRTMCEWGNDLLLNIVRTTNVLNQARHDALMRHWAKYDMTNRADRLALCRWYADRKKLIHYDDMDTFMAFRGIYYLDHVAAAWGAKYLVGETTNTTGPSQEFRWDVSGMFLRGAARQFSLPWCWYVAVYYNGPKADGKWMNNSSPRARVAGKARPFPEGGVSASSQRRAWYYAYLNGANAVEPESWTSCFFTTNTPSGRAELSDRGRNFAEFHEFTKRHPDRGVAYAPVAILTPFAQGYTATGGRAWGRCPYTDGDYAVDALFFTIAPGWKRREGIAVGNCEGNLHNSRFAMMYDVLVPDSPQPKEKFRSALFAYPAAILVGDYPEPEKFRDVLDDYVKAGGKLVRITSDLLPPRDDNALTEILRGERTFPEIEKRLQTLQDRLFPFKVKGDVQFGASRTATGWWLWTFNNRGVVKFADTFEKIDRTKDTTVSVTPSGVNVKEVVELTTGKPVAVSGGTFTCDVPAGDFRVFQVK